MRTGLVATPETVTEPSCDWVPDRGSQSEGTGTSTNSIILTIRF